MTASAFQATALAQAMMAAMGQAISVDGRWGSFTNGTYGRLSDSDRRRVDGLLAQFGWSVTRLIERRAAEKAEGTVALQNVDRSDVKAVIEAAAKAEGVPVDLAMKIAKLESNFNPKAKSPTGAKGIFQLTTIAREDVARRGGYPEATRIDPFDPIENAKVGMKYIKIVARDIGVSLDKHAEIYMGFNIGPAGARHVLAGRPEKAEKQIKVQSYGKQGVTQYAANLRAAVASA